MKSISTASPITDAELAVLRKLLAENTPVKVCVPMGELVDTNILPLRAEPDAIHGYSNLVMSYGTESGVDRTPVIEYIVAAANAIPGLLARIDELERKNHE